MPGAGKSNATHDSDGQSLLQTHVFFFSGLVFQDVPDVDLVSQPKSHIMFHWSLIFIPEVCVMREKVL